MNVTAQAAWTAATATAACAAAGAGLVLIVAHRVIHPKRAKPTRILRVDENTVTLSSSPLTRAAGVLGLLHDHEQHLAVLTHDVYRDSVRGEVRRQLQNPPVPRVRAGLGRAVGNVFSSPEHVGLPVHHTVLAAPLGPAPAWVFAAGLADTWLVHIHGSLAGREGTLRSVAAVSGTGYPSLVPSLRGDAHAPAAPAGAFLLGQTEWHDVEPALAYAVDHGARRIVLIGWSAGASMALRLAVDSAHRDLIAGVVGISPVLDWTHAIKTAARASHLPPFVATLALRALAAPSISRRLGATEPLRFGDLAWTTTSVPTLLLHTSGDSTAPYADSVALRDHQRDRVELPDLPPAPHALEWNVDPDHFARLLTDWLARLPDPPREQEP